MLRGMKIRLWVAVVVGLLIIAACTPAPAAPATEPNDDVAQKCENIRISWVNFINLDGNSYLGERYKGGRELVDEDLGPGLARVRFKVADKVCDSSYKSKHGDAAFLEPGTPIYTVKGYNPAFLLAARLDGRLIKYVVDSSPSASNGADLLDIGGKVTYIGINSETDGTTELASIKDHEKIEGLVGMVLDAPVDQERRDRDGPRYFIAFHLDDGTAVARSYWTESGLLSRGISLPVEFRMAVEEALTPSPTPPGLLSPGNPENSSGPGPAGPAPTAVRQGPSVATPDPSYTPPDKSQQSQDIPAATAAEREAASDTWLYLTAFQNGYVSVVDPVSGHELHRIPVEQGNQAGMAISPDGKRLYVVDGKPQDEGKLRVFDTASWEVVHQEPVRDRSLLLGGNPITLSPDGRWLLVGFFSYERREGWLRVFDTEKLRFLSEGAWQLDDCRLGPAKFAGHPDADQVFMQCIDFIIGLDADTLSPLWRAHSPDALHTTLALAPDGKRLYGLYPQIQTEVWSDGLSHVTEHKLELRVWEAAGGTLVEAIDMGEQVFVPEPTSGRGDAGYLAISPDGKRLYVVWEDQVWELDTGSMKVTTELKTRSSIDGVALSMDGNELYLLPSTSGNLDIRQQGMWTVDTGPLEIIRHASDWPRLSRPFFFAAPAREANSP